MRAVKTSPKRARWRAAYVLGRTSHSAICPSRRVRGPGGSPDAFMNASVHSCAMPAPATATAEQIRSVNTRYHDGAAAGYDAKWGIDYGEVGRHQVLSKVAKALGARRPLRALARGRRRHRLLQPQHAPGRVRRRRRVHRHLPRDARRAAGQRAAPGARRRHRRVRRRGAAVRGRLLRPRLRPRRAAPPARPRPRLRRVPPRAAARRAALLRRRAVALRRPHRPGPQARRVPRGAAVAAAHARRAGRRGPQRRRRGQPPARGPRRRPRLHPRPALDGRRAAPAWPTSASAARSCWPTGSGGPTARSRRPPIPTRSRGAGRSTPSRATWPSRRSTAGCSSRACRRRSSTTSSCRRATRGADRSVS